MLIIKQKYEEGLSILRKLYKKIVISLTINQIKKYNKDLLKKKLIKNLKKNFNSRICKIILNLR